MRVQSKQGWLYFSFREAVFLWHLAIGRFSVAWERRGEKW